RFHLLRGGEETLAGRGQRRASGAAVEELGAEPGFEGGDASADGGVIEPQPPRRRDELAAPGDGEEDAHIVPIHGLRFSRGFAPRASRALTALARTGDLAWRNASRRTLMATDNKE